MRFEETSSTVVNSRDIIESASAIGRNLEELGAPFVLAFREFKSNQVNT